MTLELGDFLRLTGLHKSMADTVWKSFEPWLYSRTYTALNVTLSDSIWANLGTSLSNHIADYSGESL